MLASQLQEMCQKIWAICLIICCLLVGHGLLCFCIFFPVYSNNKSRKAQKRSQIDECLWCYGCIKNAKQKVRSSEFFGDAFRSFLECYICNFNHEWIFWSILLDFPLPIGKMYINILQIYANILQFLANLRLYINIFSEPY